MTAPRCIVYFTRFDPSVERGGGSRRLMQVREMLRPHDVEIVSSVRRDWLGAGEARETDRPDAADILFRLLTTAGEYAMWSPSRRESAWRLRRISDLWRSRLGLHGPCDLALMDDPIYFPGLAANLLAGPFPLVAVCHNIESYVPSSVVPFFRRRLARREKDLLGRCRLVLTIAEEETRILATSGSQALFVPTFPPEEVERDLTAVRARRTNGGGEGILLLGSTVNEETREGMEEVISFWRKSGLERTGERLIVAGYGTDRHFFGLPRQGPVTFLGPLPGDELHSLLSSVRGAVCYQSRGGGALTRIAELLVAGVPVIANEHAARSYGSPKGLVRIENLEALPAALKGLKDIGEVEAPRRPAPPAELLDLLPAAPEVPCSP